MKKWKIGIVKDTSVPMFGLHGLHTAFQGLPNVEVVAHVDSNPENIEEKMSFTKAKSHYLTIDEMLKHETPDIVVLCSRHPYDHLEQIRTVAEKGCHIYCEKPLSASLREADEIVAIAEKNNIKICLGHPCRYGLAFLTIKKMIESGEIGIPITIYSRGKNDYRGGGEDMMVLGTHILDLQAFLFGAPETVYAEVTTNGQPIVKTSRNKTFEPIGPAAGDRIFASFRFPNNVRGIFESQKDIYKSGDIHTHMGITVVGTKGTLTMRFDDVFDRQLRISRKPCPAEYESDFEIVPLNESRIIPGVEPRDYSSLDHDIPKVPIFLESTRYAAWDLMNSIEADRQPVSNVYTARTTLEMIYGIYNSSLTQGVIKFPLQNRFHPLENYS